MMTIKEYVNAEMEDIQRKVGNNYPVLSILYDSRDPSQNSYVNGILSDCNKLSVGTIVVSCNSLFSNQYRDVVHWLDNVGDGIIITDKAIANMYGDVIHAEKDIDGICHSAYNPCTAQGIIDYLTAIDYQLCGRNACVIGRSQTVGAPLARLLFAKNATVSVCHSWTKDIYEHINIADIVFICTNEIEAYNHGFDHADVIDIGIGIGADGKIHGNLEHNYANQLKLDENKLIISGAGGVGRLTRLRLIKNLLQIK